MREFRVESAESERVQSREEGAQCAMRAQCKSTESECRGDSKGSRVQRVRESKVENPKSRVQSARVQRLREFRVESAENARAQSRGQGVECRMRSRCEVQRRECNVRVQSRECRECKGTESRGSTVHDESTV